MRLAETGVAKKVEIPGDILREMQRDGVLPPGVMIVGPLEGSRVVDCTPAMGAWCSMKAQAQPENAAYRGLASAISKAFQAGRVTVCRYGHMHPPERVWVASKNPRRPGPYHCYECPERRKKGHREDYWKPFDTPAETGRRACRVCFPSD